jgi:hypothetical protein
VDTHHLLALLPHGNVGREIADLQRALFSEYGVVSSQALPPLLPLMWAEASTPVSVAETLDCSNLPPVEPAPPTVDQYGVVLPVSLDDRWEMWITSLGGWEAVPSPAFAALLPVHGAGFFVCGNETAVTSIPDLHRGTQRLRALHLMLLRVTILDLSRPWEGIDWSVVWRRSIKLRGEDVTKS